jgi:hypothetical protein
MNKEYLVTDKELKDIIKKAIKYSKTILHPEDYISNFLKSKQPVKTLNKKEVEKVLTKGLKFCLKRNEKGLLLPTYDEEGNIYLTNIEGVVAYLLPRICSLVIPKKKIIKALKGTFGRYYKVINNNFYEHVANKILEEE